MAEISDSSRPAEGTSEISKVLTTQSDFDTKTMRKTRPGLKRLVLTFAVLFSFILGFPFLWKSVEIYRAPLPFSDIDSLSAEIESKALEFPCHFQAIFIGFDSSLSIFSKPEELKVPIFNAMLSFYPETPLCSTCSNYSLSVIVDSASNCVQSVQSNPSRLWKCGILNDVDFGGQDEHSIDEMLEARLRDFSSSASDHSIYNLVVVNRDDQAKAIVGKYRHAWIAGNIMEAEIVSRAAEIFVKVFVNGAREEGLIHGEFMPVGSDGKIVLSFSLLNADPMDWIYDWNFQAADEVLLLPIIEALSPIADISVESQVLYYTPKSSFSIWEDSLDSNIFSVDDLPFFVNANEWHLDTSIAAGGRSKILQFVVFVPSANECPLLLQLPDGELSSTNGFISPMWGGVVVWNPPCSPRVSDSKLPPRQMITSQDLQKIVDVFIGQLRQLFGLKSTSVYAGAFGSYSLLASGRGFAEWELDVLSRQHSCFNLHSCSTTLASLSRLVQSLPRMIIMDEIGKQVKYSLEAADLAQSNASLGVFDSAAVSSRQARSLAEDAFFHPSIMSVSYYSFEHCFAVYSPFFLPVALHVILAAVREWRRYKKESLKFATWKAKQSSS